MSNSPEEFFLGNLKVKYNSVKDAVETFIYDLTSGKLAEDVSDPAYWAIARLCDMLRMEDRPSWLQSAQRYFDGIKNDRRIHNRSQDIFKIATEIYPEMINHSWDFSEASSLEFDFDKIYQQHRDEQKIPELFDQVAEWLEKIIESGEIDSIKVSNQLNQIIQTLRKSKNGSYLATFGAWGLTTRWLYNSGWELFGEIPIAGALVRGLNITLKEADEAMKSMNEGMQQDFETNILAGFPKLEYHSPEIPLIESDTDTDNSETIIEVENKTEN